MYCRLLGEKPFIFGNSACRSTAGWPITPPLLVLLGEDLAADIPAQLNELLVDHPVGAELRLANLRR